MPQILVNARHTSMIMGQFKFLFILFFLVNKISFGQSFEIACGFGVSSYQGDIMVPLGSGQVKLANNQSFKFNFNSHWGLKASFSRINFEADDAKSGDKWQIERNLSFENSVKEIGLSLEFNFWPYKPLYNRVVQSPYISIGVARILFCPLAEYNGQLIPLQPLGTEGQGLYRRVGSSISVYENEYPLSGWALPISIGYRISFNKYIGFATEFNYAFTNTDYLDDISGKYFDPQILAIYKGRSSEFLSDKSSIVTGESRAVGTQRGSNSYLDNYWSLMFRLIYQIPSRNCFY